MLATGAVFALSLVGEILNLVDGANTAAGFRELLIASVVFGVFHRFLRHLDDLQG